MKKLVTITLLALSMAGGCKKGGGDKKSGDGTGIVECDQWVAQMTKFVSCDDRKFMGGQKEMYRKDLENRKAELEHASSDEAKKTEAETCKKASEELVEAAKFRGCPL